jgi:hypothetical protein
MSLNDEEDGFDLSDKDCGEENGGENATDHSATVVPTRHTLRLAKPWQGSGSCIITDNWFGPFNTAEWLWDKLVLLSIKAVKNEHRGFP